MRYLILITVLLVGCTNKLESRLWKIKTSCVALGKLVNAKTVRMFDKEENDKINAICEISKPRGFTYWLRNEEVQGALRGIKLFHNRNKVEKLDSCYKENKCEDYNFAKLVECLRKCHKKVKWMD